MRITPIRYRVARKRNLGDYSHREEEVCVEAHADEDESLDLETTLEDLRNTVARHLSQPPNVNGDEPEVEPANKGEEFSEEEIERKENE